MSERLDDIRRRLEAATPGPWTNDSHYIADGSPAPLVSGPYTGLNGETKVIRIADCETGWRAFEEQMANAALIAHAPADIAYLLEQVSVWQQTTAQALAEVERLRAEVEARKAEW